MSAFDTVVSLVYLAAAASFVLGLRLMNTPATARRGNQISALGMVFAVAVTLVRIFHQGGIGVAGWAVLGSGTAVGTVGGWYAARAVRMTDMPQLVSLFNAAGGGAAAAIGMHDIVRLDGTHTTVAAVLDVVIGTVTFSGSLVAAGKLQGMVPGRPVFLPGARIVNACLAAAVFLAAGYLLGRQSSGAVLGVLVLAALAVGVALVMPIGGADMPVVISLLNAFTGTAVAMAGFVIDSSVLIIAGGLVGASGTILTLLMAEAMNRSVLSIIAGGFGAGDNAAPAGGGTASVREVSVDDAAIQLGYASKVIIVPGYGLAAARAQYEVHELAELLEARGVDVSYAIHPVAGRMPGHMNVLLAEAHVPYTQLKEMDEANQQFPRTDVALVIGANDVTNPAARRVGTALSGMPILDVDQAGSVIVIKRSMGHGYAGIDNELYTNPKTGMCFSDAKAGLAAITAAIKVLVR